MSLNPTKLPERREAERKPLASSQTQRFTVHADFASLLQRHGLIDCNSLCDSEIGTPLRRLRHRENWRLDLAENAGTRTLFLKKHRIRTLGTWLRARLGIAAPSSAARVEAETTACLAELGVPTMTVVAYGEQLRRDGTLVAAFLSDELKGFEQLDLFLPRRFSSSDDRDLRSLLLKVAEVAGRFHRLGFNHRDLYTCHFFIREDRRGEFAVHLIDLQRVQHWPKLLRDRWYVKDLAQLAYSTHPGLVRATDRLRFLLRYRRTDRLDRAGKRFARAVLRKAATLQRKHGPYRNWSTMPLPVQSEPTRSNERMNDHEDRACA
jgi:heptose I phosphotransferase